MHSDDVSHLSQWQNTLTLAHCRANHTQDCLQSYYKRLYCPGPRQVLCRPAECHVTSSLWHHRLDACRMAESNVQITKKAEEGGRFTCNAGDLHACSTTPSLTLHVRSCCSLPLQAQAACVEDQVRGAGAGVRRVLQRAVVFDGVGMQATAERPQRLPEAKVPPMLTCSMHLHLSWLTVFYVCNQWPCG